MREMKDSGLDWVDSIPSNWKINRIKYLFNMKKGLPITKESLIESGLPVISYGQIHSKDNTSTSINESLKRFVSYNYQVLFPKCEVREHDFIFADTSEDYDGCGNFIYKRDNNLLYAGYHSIILSSNLTQDNRYFAYLFLTDSWRRQIREKVSGVKVFSITQRNITNAFIILPPIKEQKEIADFLDKKCSEIDALAKDIEKQIEVLEDYKKSVITEAVTKGLNPNVEMKDSGVECVGVISTNRIVTKLKYALSEPMKYGASESGVDYNADLPRYIRITDITLDGKLKEDGKLSLTNEQAQGYILKDNTILFARSGATVGKTFMYKKEYGKSAFAGYLISGVPNKNIANPKWIYYCVNSSYYWDWCNIIFNQATIQNIGADKYSNFPLVIASYEEQNVIVNYLDKALEDIDSLLSDKKKQLSLLADYKKSLIYEYVTGKKVVENDAKNER